MFHLRFPFGFVLSSCPHLIYASVGAFHAEIPEGLFKDTSRGFLEKFENISDAVIEENARSELVAGVPGGASCSHPGD